MSSMSSEITVMDNQSRSHGDSRCGCWYILLCTKLLNRKKHPENLLLSVCRWWAFWVTPAVFLHSHNTTSPYHHSTVPWTPLHPMPSQLAAASVQLTPPLRRWTAFRHRNPTAPLHTAPPATAWIPLWLPPVTSTVSMARVSPDSSH